ncbi:hypothetical protein G9409_08255 [Chlorobium sp. BLA1]|uniref:hypothetical protein n=1 Tax=Candidatus Chlorobium masyuteum TaxID=2716876 RepID=UPI0014202816|nr:hypothetical protein [Candidatus Chlorobium masyuteum]NHQ60578.1 hypothetical protein [Candidatus Chlorobium masyuteum]
MAITNGEKEKKGDERQPGNTEGAGSEEQSQGSEKKNYSQTEVDALIKGKLKEFADVNVEEYRTLKEAKAQQEREVLEKKGDFEKILAQTVKEKDEVIGQRDKDIASLTEQLRTIRVDNTLLAAASTSKAINPAQIVTLLKGNVHYDQKTDQVEVRENGAPMYKSGKPVTVEQFVHDFLQANPHHLPAGPSGSGAGGSTTETTGDESAFKLSVEDAKDPAKYRAVRDAAAKAGRTVVIER